MNINEPLRAIFAITINKEANAYSIRRGEQVVRKGRRATQYPARAERVIREDCSRRPIRLSPAPARLPSVAALVSLVPHEAVSLAPRTPTSSCLLCFVAFRFAILRQVEFDGTQERRYYQTRRIEHVWLRYDRIKIWHSLNGGNNRNLWYSKHTDIFTQKNKIASTLNRN